MIGSATGTTPITLPNNFNELFIKVDATKNHDVFYFFLLPRIALSTEAKKFVNVFPSDNDGYCDINVSLRNIHLRYSYSANENITSSANTTVYYR